MGDERRLRAVVELAQAMAAAQALPDVALAAAAGAREALGGAFAALAVIDTARGRLRVVVNEGVLAEGEEAFPADESYPVGDFPEIAGEPRARVESLAEGASSDPRAEAQRRSGRSCRVVAPAVLHGRIWGELQVARGPDEPGFTARDADFATVLAAVVAAGLAQHERLAEARRLAFTDPLTGLANRRAVDIRLDEAVERHRATGAVVSLVVCDINGLKRVNDTYGHAAGDRLLERFGAVLAVCAASVPGALAGRLGGDEFCLLADGTGLAHVERAARDLCRRAGELDIGSGVACGIASTAEAVGPVSSARRLFRLADAAQYRAKAAGAREPVVAGRGGAGGAAVALADAPGAPGGDRRGLRGRARPAPGEESTPR
ncbi:GGDEF domain-containing protein [Streptomyces sp. PT12]|uniref:GGDEF domain-containing protein n=1 Tax=Streptomyces sp. PT12 TaxID=1510197 RepID=UPI000DE1F190|nr:GGDEF domain-containing protein [Streptomyces sp. PT12]RBM11707.1 diguanylate cyclase [Streptomyces sp. PT12]